MPRLPYLQPLSTSRIMTDVFRGYNHNAKIADGEMHDMLNLSSDHYPVLSTRRPRGVKKTMTDPGGLLEKDALCYVDNGTLYVNHLATAITSLTPGEKQLVSMGAYVVIFPDKRYYNTENPQDLGYLESDYSFEGSVSYAPCDVDGNPYSYTASGTEPSNPQNGAYWIDTTNNAMYQYSSASGVWTDVATVYTRVGFSTTGTVPSLFREGDTVDITGLAHEDLNGSKHLYKVGGDTNNPDYIVVIGLISSSTSESGTVRIQRTIPDMDYVIECQNRLWGCKYGMVDGKIVNEIYCSALGDFRNWRVYQGLSTDSWAVSIGSDGQWTGAVNYLGHPTFFKENHIHTVNVSAEGAHRVDETPCRGVQKGSSKSLAIVGETLYYKSRTDVCAWQGGFPVGVSAAFGEGVRYYNAVGGVFGTKYYLSMQEEDGDWTLMVYDTTKGLWIREDELHALCFAKVDDELWCIDADGRLLAMLGTEGEKESLSWMMETGMLHYEYPDKKYLSRYDVRLSMSAGATAKIWMEYDSSGTWVESGRLQREKTGTVVIPIRPRRCDHLRFKLTGTGEVKIFSIARTLEVGSDV